LRALGIRIALDDFGVKYSSLEYLQRLPVDTVKIDRVFIDGIPTNRFNASIVRAVVSVAHELGFKVTAEGVESEEELDLVKTLGCDSWQGFLLSPALPPESVTPLLPSPAVV
jgi:EAL domain-containing protein (putative c-di-GMP-specific phosphodiesterase class I)